MLMQPGPNDRPHNHPPRMAAFSEAIMRGGTSIPFHPFVVEVLDYFNIVLFQFTPFSLTW